MLHILAVSLALHNTYTHTQTGSEISTEPMYILLNTAVSKQWGFPQECPANCPCETLDYDCNSDKWQATCGFSEGFCEMMGEKDPEYKINWVRVYQDPTNEQQKVGCSTPERPTRRFIEAHEKLYKTEDDAFPLKGIQQGRGPCNPYATDVVSAASCGGIERGRCSMGRVCECHRGWTGPHCLAHDGSDPVAYDLPSKITDLGFQAPMTPILLVVCMATLFFLLLVVLQYRSLCDGWMPIPDSAKAGKE